MLSKTKIKALFLSALMALGLIAGTTVTAGEASARVNSGKYTFHSNMWGIRESGSAVVRGNTLYLSGRPFRMIPTRKGAFADIGPNRYIFNRVGNAYRGDIYWVGIRAGRTALTPRR